MTPRRWILLFVCLGGAALGGLFLQQWIRSQQEAEIRAFFGQIKRGMDLEEVEEILGPGGELLKIGDWGAQVQWKKHGCVMWVQVNLNARVCDVRLSVPQSRTFLQWLRFLFR